MDVPSEATSKRITGTQACDAAAPSNVPPGEVTAFKRLPLVTNSRGARPVFLNIMLVDAKKYQLFLPRINFVDGHQ